VANLGLDKKQTNELTDLLNRLLADEFVLYTKLRKYHWNVTGPNFRALHLAFEEQYTALEALIDEAAELVRQYGAFALGTLDEFGKHTRLQEQPGVNPAASAMVEDAAACHEAIVQALRADSETVDEGSDDPVVQDFFTRVMTAHQKFAWMLRATLENSGDAALTDAVSRMTLPKSYGAKTAKTTSKTSTRAKTSRAK
jgi:starvation-inducible DNA-binding protein